MADAEYSIFYSWQSDLPNSETRGLIQDSINAAVKGLRDTISVEADRDTKGVYGSPDIVQTIFSKIDNCDVFVADVSAVSVYNPLDKDGKPTDRVKATPNPNVLLELGYAIQTVGWDNIICIMNEDYNRDGEVPFDLEHHRLTRFSLKEREKADVRRELRDIISGTILNLMENGKRVKSNFSNIIVGSFNTENNVVESTLVPLDVHTSVSIQQKITLIKETCSNLINEIMEKELPQLPKENEPEASCGTPEQAEKIIRKNGEILTPLTENVHIDLFKPHRVEIKEEEKLSTYDQIKQLFGIEVPDSFFEFGGLKQRPSFGIQPSLELEGTDDEKDKYDKYIALGSLLANLDMWEMYLETFSDYVLIPLAITNESSVADSEIKIYVEVNPDTAEAVFPSAEILSPKLKGIEGWVYEEDLIKNTLLMPEDTNISYDSDLSFSLHDAHYELEASLRGGLNGAPLYNDEDYARELSKFVASPLIDNQNLYSFEINALFAKETKWIGPLIMVKPKADKVELTYVIKSKSSDGSLSGKLAYIVEIIE